MKARELLSTQGRETSTRTNIAASGTGKTECIGQVGIITLWCSPEDQRVDLGQQRTQRTHLVVCRPSCADNSAHALPEPIQMHDTLHQGCGMKIRL